MALSAFLAMRHSNKQLVLLTGVTSGFDLLAEPQKRCHINRKLFLMILIKRICNAEGAFLDVYNGNPGSVYDALEHQCTVRTFIHQIGTSCLEMEDPYLHHPVSIVTPFCQPLASKLTLTHREQNVPLKT